MGPEAAAYALMGDQIEEMGEVPEWFIEEYEKYIDIRQQASQMEVDELIPAGDLREQLESRFRVLETKEREEIDRHHGTVLF
jgi:acetyl-CoA carboxylase carboxyltransferase component